MGFIYQLKSHEKIIPGRAYLHSFGAEFYGKNRFEIVESAREFLKEIQKNRDFSNIAEKEKLLYFLAAMWAENGTRVADIFGFKNIPTWPGNPEILNYDYRNNTVTPMAFTCGDSIIAFGREEEHRRKTKSLEEYLLRPPKFVNKVA